MMIIYKYPLELRELQYVAIPGLIRILDIQVQHGVPCMWAMVHPEQEKRDYAIRMTGTGCPESVEPHPESYLGTIQLNGFVWHYFKET